MLTTGHVFVDVDEQIANQVSDNEILSEQRGAALEQYMRTRTGCTGQMRRHSISQETVFLDRG